MVLGRITGSRNLICNLLKRIGDNAVAVVEVVEKGFEGGKLSFHSFRFELFVKSCNIGF